MGWLQELEARRLHKVQGWALDSIFIRRVSTGQVFLIVGAVGSKTGEMYFRVVNTHSRCGFRISEESLKSQYKFIVTDDEQTRKRLY